jgi:hypothetical protein
MEVSIAGSLELVSPFDGASGDASIEVGLGLEDQLNLVRNVRYREESAGLLGGSRRHITEVEVQVASALAHPVRVEVLQRVPVSPNEDVSIALTEQVPASEAYTGDPDGVVLEGGRRQWLEVKPGGKGSTRLGYAVTLSNREQLVGGDRRG